MERGVPRQFLTDNGLEFCNRLVQQLMESQHVDFIHGRPYHPQTQGIVEVFNKTLHNLIWNVFLVQGGENFDLKTAHRNSLFEYNTKKHSSTQEKPVDCFQFTSNEDFERVNANFMKKFNSKNRNFEYEKGMKVLITDHVFKISGNVN